MIECRGTCLVERNGIWVKSPDSNCTQKCTPIKCPNFPFCGQENPKYVFDYTEKLCMKCTALLTRKIDFVPLEKKETCCVCLEDVELMVKLPNCIHHICPSCYRKSIWSNCFEGKERDRQEFELNEIKRLQITNRCPLCRAPYQQVAVPNVENERKRRASNRSFHLKVNQAILAGGFTFLFWLVSVNKGNYFNAKDPRFLSDYLIKFHYFPKT